jgi:hypothetical protein
MNFTFCPEARASNRCNCCGINLLGSRCRSWPRLRANCVKLSYPRTGLFVVYSLDRLVVNAFGTGAQICHHMVALARADKELGIFDRGSRF